MHKPPKWTVSDVKAAVERLGITRLSAQPKREMVEQLTVTINRLLPGMNGAKGLIRQNFRAAGKVKDEVLAEVKSGRYGTFGNGRVVIVATRWYCGNEMDSDNCASSFKYFLDAVVKCGIIADDGPKFALIFYIQKKCITRKFQKMTLEITSNKETAKNMMLSLFEYWSNFS